MTGTRILTQAKQADKGKVTCTVAKTAYTKCPKKVKTTAI
jgi:hypothetical protein